MANPFIAMVFGFLKDNSIDTKDLSVQEAIDKYQEMSEDDGKKAKEEVLQSNNGMRNIVELDKENELSKLIRSTSQSKYKTIKQYLQEAFKEQPIALPDGKKAVVGSKDMDELAHKADNKKVAELSKLKELINASQFDNEKVIAHTKFSKMRYYVVSVKLNGEISDVWINVGENKYDKKLHIYDLVPKK